MVDHGTVTAIEPASGKTSVLPNAAHVAPWASGERSSRANNFDAIRLTLAVLVIVSHAWSVSFGRVNYDPDRAEPLVWWTHGQIGLGNIAVHGFFIISGYLIAASLLNSRSLANYLLKRVRRIYPGYLVAVAVSLGVAAWAGAGWQVTPIEIAKRLASSLLLRDILMPSAFAANPLPGVVNASMWTIQYEFYCYLLLIPLAGLVRRGRGGAIAAIVGLMAVLAAVVVVTAWEGRWGHASVLVGRPEVWPRLVSHFLAGTAFYICRRRIPHRVSWAIAAALLLVIGARVPPLVLVVSPLALTYLLMWLAYHPTWRLNHFGRYGDFSYGVYLYAFPIQQSLVYAGLTHGPWANIVLATPLALLAGIASWHGCEKWFVHYRPTGRRPDAV